VCPCMQLVIVHYGLQRVAIVACKQRLSHRTKICKAVGTAGVLVHADVHSGEDRITLTKRWRPLLYQAIRTQEDPGGPKRIQEDSKDPGRARRTQEDPGGPRRTQE
jgi:hypothetical protein